MPIDKIIQAQFKGLQESEAIQERFQDILNEQQLFDQIRKVYKDVIGPESLGYHFVLTGNPGTGKSTYGKVIGKVLNSIGIRKSDKVVYIDRTDIVGAYIGHTESNMKDILTKVIDQEATLFIDEAYTLFSNSQEDYGRKALETLLKVMTDQGHKFTVILAGYKELMEDLLGSNPGLSSRFNYTISLKDYSDETLVKIGESYAYKRGGFYLTKGAKLALSQNIERERIDDKFGNIRYVENKVDSAIRSLSQRKFKQKIDEKFFILESIDFGLHQVYSNQEKYNQAHNSMDKLIGLSSVKEQIYGIIARDKIDKLRRNLNIKCPKGPSMHMVFTGNPGTGKTTVARLIGQLYQSLGLLKRGDVFIECNRQDLVSNHVGGTAIKTQKMIDKALGGVLFIDEAYSLVNKGDKIGQEAIDILISEMENKSDKLMVILAGYEDDMNRLLKSNDGFTSRIQHYLDFPDYNQDELLRIFDLELDKWQVEHKLSHNDIRKFIEICSSKNDFGNGRGIRNLVNKLLIQQAIRITKLNEKDQVDYIHLLKEVDFVVVMDKLEGGSHERKSLRV